VFLNNGNGKNIKMGSRRPGQSTLAVFIQSLEGTKLVIELRRDTIIRGTLTSVDESLNLQLTDAIVKTLDGTQRIAANLHVRGSAVRFIHLPGNLEPAAAVEAHRRRIAQAHREHAAKQGSVTALGKGKQFELDGGASGGG
jgi:small nuclear ribonucleoprotein (snRNP)-like protein